MTRTPSRALSADHTDCARDGSRWSVWKCAPEDESLEVSEFAYRGTSLRQFVQRFADQRLAVLAIGILGVFVVAAILAPLIATHDPNAIELRRALELPSADHWLGTDSLGRDIYSRIVYAGRVSLTAAAQATTVAVAIGVPVGLVAGYFRGRVDTVVMLANDGLMALPPLLLAVAILGAVGPGLTNAMFAVGILFAPRFIRLVRATVLSLREETYVEASVASGTRPAKVIIRHMLPNALPPLLVQMAFTIGFAMLAEASLSFLGLGVQVPQASWGSMLNRAYSEVTKSAWVAVPPGIAIAVAVLMFNVIGDGLRDAVGRERRSE